MRFSLGILALVAAAPALAAGPSVTRQQARWIERFESERLVDGYGAEPRGIARVDLTVSEAEFRQIARRHGWVNVPRSIKFRYAEAPRGPAMTAEAARQVRIFPQADRAQGLVHMAAYSGRIVLRDGCLFVEQGLPKRAPMLAYFPREMGLYVDRQGQLALRTRAARPRHLGRIGEVFSWAGPIAIDENAPMIAELRNKCGNAPLMHLSIAESETLFHRRYPHLRRPPPPPSRG